MGGSLKTIRDACTKVKSNDGWGEDQRIASHTKMNVEKLENTKKKPGRGQPKEECLDKRLS